MTDEEYSEDFKRGYKAGYNNGVAAGWLQVTDEVNNALQPMWSNYQKVMQNMANVMNRTIYVTGPIRELKPVPLSDSTGGSSDGL